MTQSSISFDHAADFYDETRALRVDVAQGLTDALMRELRAVDAEHALEVGVGTGRIALPLAERGVRVTGIDIAPRMLARLTGQLRTQHVAPDLMLGDAPRLPFVSESFPAVLLCHVLHLIPEWKLAVAEMRRVLSPGGVLLHHGDSNFGMSEWDPAGEKWEELLKARGFVQRARPKNKDTSAAFEAIGGSCRIETISEWEEASTPAEELELARDHVHSWTWEIPDELFFDCLPEVERWAGDYYGSLDRRLERRVAYRLQVWRFA